MFKEFFEKKENTMILAGALVLGLLIGGGIMFFVKGGGNGSVNLYPTTSAQVGGDWLVKIDDYAIGKNEFDTGFKMAMNLYPEQQKAAYPEGFWKQQYLDNLISQYVITLQAMKSGKFEQKEPKIYLQAAIRQAVYQIYLLQNIPQDNSGFAPSNDEISQYVAQNSTQMDRMGLNSEQRKMYAVQDLKNRKMKMWEAQFVERTKENFKIQRNDALLQKEGVGMIPQQQNPAFGLPNGGAQPTK